VKGKPKKNTDRELYREDLHDPLDPDNAYAPKIFVTLDGQLGINVGGLVHVMPIRKWHFLGGKFWYMNEQDIEDMLSDWDNRIFGL
jgi:hypothetical protein